MGVAPSPLAVDIVARVVAIVAPFDAPDGAIIAPFVAPFVTPFVGPFVASVLCVSWPTPIACLQFNVSSLPDRILHIPSCI